jgi:hypothetical protein
VTGRTRFLQRVILAIAAGATAYAAPQVDPARAPVPVKVPAGTTINVRLTEGIDVDVAQAGMKVRAIVDDPVMFDGRIIIPREARAVLQAVRVTQSGEFKGKDAISLKMNSISFGGRSYQVVTEYATVEGKGEGKRTARKVGGGAGLGAIIGGVAGGGSGALIGGVVGGIGGAAVASQGEEHLKLEAETRLQFALSTTVVIQP